MATRLTDGRRPWVTPGEVKDYSDNPKIQNRNEEKLKVDIFRAEQYVIRYTGNTFKDDAKFPAVPEGVRLAVILLAEMYATSAAEYDEKSGNYKSETFDEYSYTLADTAKKQENIDLGPLLDEYVVSMTKNAVNMKLRKL